MHKDNFDKGIDIGITENPLGFIYGKDVFGPTVENRWLDDIRSSLLDPKCEGPDIVYSIAMDVGKTVHKALLQKQHLLFGVVAYAKGSLGMEPIRSQGHIHKVTNGMKEGLYPTFIPFLCIHLKPRSLIIRHDLHITYIHYKVNWAKQPIYIIIAVR